MSTPKKQHRFDPQEVEQSRQDYLNSSNVIVAGLLRNENMLSVGTHLVAFLDGDPYGTKKMIDLAREKGIPVWVINY